MYCKNCGKKLISNADFCPDCGASVKDGIIYNESNKSKFNTENFFNNPWVCAIIGFLVPVAGIIFYFVWKNDNEKKKQGKYLGIGALINIGIQLLIILLFLIFLVFSIALFKNM